MGATASVVALVMYGCQGIYRYNCAVPDVGASVSIRVDISSIPALVEFVMRNCPNAETEAT